MFFQRRDVEDRSRRFDLFDLSPDRDASGVFTGIVTPGKLLTVSVQPERVSAESR